MFGFINKVFMCANAFESVSMNNQECKIRSGIIEY